MRNFGLIYSRLEKKEIGVWFVRSGSINEQICPSMEHWDSSKTQVVVPVFPRLMWLDQVLDSKRGQVKRKCWKVENLIGPLVICKISIAPNYRFTFLFYHFIVKIYFLLTASILFSEKVHSVLLEKQNSLCRQTQFTSLFAVLPQKELWFFTL